MLSSYHTTKEVVKMSRNPENQRGLNNLSEGEVGWLAGIFEGEGYCGLKGHSGFTVQITMTDLDIVDRIQSVSGVGTVRGPFDRGNKPYKTWTVGSQDGVAFLEAILPWLGERRSERAREAINRWRNNKKQTRPGDTHCINGHEFTPENTHPTYSGNGKGCKICRQASLEKYRAKKRAEDPNWDEKRRAEARERYQRQKKLKGL
jgi:hypothetical protein